MNKILAVLSLSSLSSINLAAHTVHLSQAPLSQLNSYVMLPLQTGFRAHVSQTPLANQLQLISQTSIDQQTVQRYQQLYHGIPVVGAQVMVSNNQTHGLQAGNQQPMVNGQLLDEININTQPTITTQEAMTLAKTRYWDNNNQAAVSDEDTQLQIRSTPADQMQLVYQVSFRTLSPDSTEVWLFFIIDAHTGMLF